MSSSANYLRKLEFQRTSNAAASTFSVTTAKQSWRPVTKAILNGFVSKYQNRRSQLLKSVNPFRSPINISRIQMRKSVFVNGQRLRVHDIVSVLDSEEEEKKYFGQITSLLTDSYAKHYICLVWLVPKFADSFALSFSAEKFVHGIAEERPIPMECCKFESICPLLPRYMCTWTPERLLEERTRVDLERRVRDIRAIANLPLPNIRDDFKKIV